MSQWLPCCLHFKRWSHCVLTFCPPCSLTVDGEFLIQVPNPSIDEQPGWNFYDYGSPWNDDYNPWWEGNGLAPFDKEHIYLKIWMERACEELDYPDSDQTDLDLGDTGLAAPNLAEA